jgi:hypothetical protein
MVKYGTESDFLSLDAMPTREEPQVLTFESSRVGESEWVSKLRADLAIQEYL